MRAQLWRYARHRQQRLRGCKSNTEEFKALLLQLVVARFVDYGSMNDIMQQDDGGSSEGSQCQGQAATDRDKQKRCPPSDPFCWPSGQSKEFVSGLQMSIQLYQYQ